MPLKGFICPDGERITIDDCLKEGGCRRNDRCASRTYLHMASSERPWTGVPSTTMLINGTMLANLRLSQPYYVSPDSRAFMLHGTMAHAKLTVEDDYSLIEEKLDGAGTEVTGIFDIYEEENGVRKLIDTKTSGSYKVMKALGFYSYYEPTGEVFKSGKRKGEPKMRKMQGQSDDEKDVWEWQLQLNMYRIQLERLGFPVDRLQIQCIPRDGGTYIATSRGVLKNVYLFDIDFLPDDQVLEYFKRKRRALLYALRYGWTKPCSAKENWDGIRCARFCEVAQHCPYGKYLVKEKEKLAMPIDGLSEVVHEQIMGKFRLGIKVPNKNGQGEHPEEIRHFRIDPTSIQDETKKQAYIDAFHEKYKTTEPTSLNVIFANEDMEVTFPQWYKAYGSGSGLKCKGDGKTAECISEDLLKTLKPTGEKGERGYPMVVCKGAGTKQDPEGTCCPHFGKKNCNRVASLRFYVPDIPGIALWEVVTSSVVSITNINSALKMLKDRLGHFSWLPLELMRVPIEMTHDGKKRTHYVLAINMNVSLLELMKYSKQEPVEIMQSAINELDEHADMQYQADQPTALPEAAPLELPENVEDTDQVLQNYAQVCHRLAEDWGEDTEVISGFLIHNLDTEDKAYQIIMQNLTDENWMTDMKNLFNQWVVKEAKIDEPEETEEKKTEPPKEEKKEEKPPPRKKNGEFTYDTLIVSLSQELEIDKKKFATFAQEFFGTKGKATLGMRKALLEDEPKKQLEEFYAKWEKEKAESTD